MRQYSITMGRTMSEKPKKLSDQLRAAMMTSELSQNEIARRSGVDVATVNKFIKGRRAGISTAAWDALGEVLGLELTAKKKRKGN